MLTFRDFAKTCIHTNIQYYWEVYKLLVDIIGMNNVRSIIGFGAGDCTFERLIYQQHPDLDITVIDFEYSNEFKWFDDLEKVNQTFDIATSLECLYLLNDDELKNHVKEMYKRLNDSGIYIITDGFGKNNPNLEQRINEASDMYKHIPLIPKSRTVQEYTLIFETVGFKVGVKTIGHTNIPLFGISDDNDLEIMESEIASHRIFVLYK